MINICTTTDLKKPWYIELTILAEVQELSNINSEPIVFTAHPGPHYQRRIEPNINTYLHSSIMLREKTMSNKQSHFSAALVSKSSCKGPD